MNKQIVAFLCVVALAAGAVGLVCILLADRPSSGPEPGAGAFYPPQQRPAHMRQRAPWEPYGFQLRKGPRTRRYNLGAIVSANPGAEPNVRLLLNVQDPANYYFVELTEQGTRIGKVESGLEADLGSHSSQGLRLDGLNKVVLKRRYDLIEVILNDTVVARAEDESFHGGQIGAGVLADSARVRLGAPQPCDPIYFADDFMKTAAEERGWATVGGTWRVATIRNPSLSSNAFYFVGNARRRTLPATAVRGERFWDNYRFRVACASFGTEDVGIYFYYRDQKNYYLFRWNAATQGRGRRARKQLIKCWHGEKTVLGEAPGGYQPRVWYELAAEVVGSRIRTFIDGHEVFNVTDEDLCLGQIGLYTGTPYPTTAHFDDVLVQSARSFEEDFATAAAGRWRPLHGSWERRERDGRHFYLVSAERPAKAISGGSRWRNYTLSATIRLPAALSPASEVGLVAHYLDETNFALFAWRPAAGTARLEGLVDGEQEACERLKAPRAPPSTSHLLELTWRQSVVTARLDGRAVASAWVPNLPNGKTGLYASAVKGLAFENVHVAFPLPPEPVLTAHEVFAREHTMEIWAGAASDWENTYEAIDGQQVKARWHRADFFGNATVEVELKEAAAKAAASRHGRRACHLVLGAKAKRVRSGYSFVLSWPGSDGSADLRATLTRGGHMVRERLLKLDVPVKRLRIQRLGDHLVASLNQEPILAFRDPQPLNGCHAGCATVNLTIPKEDVNVFSDNVKVYTFSRASNDWRPAAGTWMTTNRWECDPRWSFFCGIPDNTMLAAIWNKRAFEGDVSVEFAVGPKMDNTRGGGNYRYARDFNVTMCADGRHISSGYSFLFGGWDDTTTAITRRGRIVARSSYVIPRSSNIHRRWFYVKVEKRGSTLTYWIDGNRILSYTDPAPLRGNRIAIWSWDCAIMVSRVRLCAATIKGKEPPGTPSGPCRTIYSVRR